MKEMRNAITQLALTDIYRTCHSTAAEYRFFSSACGTFNKIDYILDHKTNWEELKWYKLSSEAMIESN